jgi:simple sugar transport system substrate-binding protein/ribose transport system substrate-binding protein
MKRSKVIAVLAAAAVALAGCGGGTTGAGGSKIGVDFPRSDSDFWNSYNTFVPTKASGLGVTLLPPTNSNNDIGTLVANVQSLVTRGAKAVVMAPQDTGAIKSTLDQLDTKKIPVVSVDTRPDAGKVFMVVRADNKAYGEKACTYLGEKLHGAGNVVEFQGDLASINGRDRSEAFANCMKTKYPKIVVHAVPTEWKADKASAGLQTVLSQTNNNIQGIYMQAGGVFLAPTLQVLQQKNLLKPAGQPGHIQIVSNDGIKQELDGIKKGDIDATVSQPADDYAKWGLFYAKAGAEGKTFKAGPTDHDSTIITLPNGLEDQLAAPLVTKTAGTFGDFKSVAADDSSLWGNQ